MRHRSRGIRTTLFVLGAFAAGWFGRDPIVQITPAILQGGETLRSLLNGVSSDKTGSVYFEKKANNRRVAANNGVVIPDSDWFKSTVTGSGPDDQSYYIVAVPEFISGMEDQAQVVAFCEDNVIRLYISMVKEFGPDPLVVSWSVDEEVKQVASWQVSGDRRMIGLWYTDKAVPFIESLFGGSTLIARVQDRTGMQKTKVFQIRGIEKAIPHLRDHCTWPADRQYSSNH